MSTTNNKCKKCGCEDSFMTSPAPCPTPEGCPTPEPCSEVMDSQCVIYTGANIECGQDTVVTTNNTVAEAIESIVDYFCSNQPIEFQYEIGEYVEDEGGVIFHRYLDGNTQNYLVVSISNQETSEWSNINLLIGSSAQSSWNGLSNSNAIVGQSGFTNGAAKVCLDLISLTKNDWYLPAIDELNLLWNNRFNVNRTLSGNSSSGPINDATQLQISTVIWSSSEANNENAWLFDFSIGGIENVSKSGTFAVRAVRKFSI